MQNALGQVQERTSFRPTREVSRQNGPTPTAKEIPYDYVATFTLTGRPGNRIQDVINISIDGAFVAVAIGYSFIPARLPDFKERNDQAVRDQILSQLGNSPGNQLIPGVNLLTTLVGIAGAAGLGQRTLRQSIGLLQPLVNPLMILQCLLVRLCGIDFRYSIIDSSTGRELQNRPIHNIAGLGESTGDRPFRPMAKPIFFMPRSTIRIEVEEVSEGFPYGYVDGAGRPVGAELYIVLHGYKMLGYGTGLP